MARNPFAATPGTSGGGGFSGGGGGGASNPFAAGGSGAAAAPAPKKKRRGGILGIPGRTLGNLQEIAWNSPGGIYHTYQSLNYDLLHHPFDFHNTRTFNEVVKPMAVGTKQDLRHPLRNPGYTLLDILALGSIGAGTAARAAAVGKLGTGARAGEIASTALRGPKVGTRTIRSGDLSVELPESRSALTRATVRQIDELRNRYPGARVPGLVRDQPSRVGKALAKERALEYKLHTIPFTQLRVAGRKIGPNSPRGRALRAVAEGTTLETVIDTATRDLATATSKYDRKNLKREIRIASEARKYVENETLPDGTRVPRLSDPKLQALYDETKAAALLEDERIAEMGLADPAVLQEAIQKPGRVYAGARYVAPTGARLGKPSAALQKARSDVDRLQGLYDRALAREAKAPKKSMVRRPNMPEGATAARSTLTERLGGALSVQRDKLARMEAAAASKIEPTGLVGAEEFQAGEFHVGQERRPKAFAVRKAPVIGSANTIGIPTTPGRLTHALTGAAIHKGGLRHDVPALVADNALESERHAALLRARDFFIEHAQDAPEGIDRPIPIRLDELGRKPFPDAVKQLQDAYRQGRHLNVNQTGVLGMSYDSIRQRVFPSAEELGFPNITPADVPASAGVKWIDERYLGGLNKPRPLASVMQHPAARGAVRLADAVNNATKLSILYLKPAYAVPNIVGNTFLTLTQQGVFAPRNLATAVTLSRKIGEKNAVVVDNLMGEGITASLASQGGADIVARATAKGSQFWSKPVDLPFRRASFLHEARKAGFRTPARIKQLLHDERHAKELHQIQLRANRAIIDYGDLGPLEQDIIRRVVFFYPWVKGSIKYAGTYITEHPQQAAVLGQLGKQGKELQQRELGDVPPFAEGLFKVGERNGVPMVANPIAAGILSQPADIAAIVEAFASGHVPKGREASSLLTPFLGAGTTALSGYDQFTGRPVEPNVSTFLHQLTAAQPLPTLVSRLRHDQSQRLFPLSDRDAILQILFGGLAPRPVNRAKLNAFAQSANEPRGG